MIKKKHTKRFCRLQSEQSATSRGFTLVELLVVISIIALLLSILMPSLKKARDLGKKTVCLFNLRQQGTMFRMYANDNNGRIPPSHAYARITPGGGLNWEPWCDFLRNGDYKDLSKKQEVFFCPAMPRREDPLWSTDYGCSVAMMPEIWWGRQYESRWKLLTNLDTVRNGNAFLTFDGAQVYDPWNANMRYRFDTLVHFGRHGKGVNVLHAGLHASTIRFDNKFEFGIDTFDRRWRSLK